MGSLDTPSNESDGDLIGRVLGYLNFSSGASDPLFLSALNQLFVRTLPDDAEATEPMWRRVCDRLTSSLKEMKQDSPAFADAHQASRLLELVRQFGPAYMAFHADLLKHQTEAEVVNSLFMGRAIETLLSIDREGEDADILHTAITRINDFIGYRPVATLESQKIEPYSHEWIRPVPIFIRKVGPAAGKYEAIVAKCVELLNQTDSQILRQAYFDPARMEELAVDPRAYDFDQPANKRPNYHFGQWDPHHIDGDGFYTRFVVQEVTLDSLIERVTGDRGLDSEELIVEAAAVLAGTILMSSGISGFGPETHPSTVSLAGLLADIAAYRDEFYRNLLTGIGGTHGARLREEANRLQQPFGGARQDLNRQLTARRAEQLQRVHLSRIFARMKYSDAAMQQVDSIQVPSARIACLIDCHLTEARTAIADGDTTSALASIESSREAMLRGIECGALVDPWNILGFDGNFCLFGGIENSLRDYRVDDLIDIVEETLELYARVWSKSAATNQTSVAEEASRRFYAFANWWHQFAAHEIDSVEAEDPLQVYEAAENVANALQAWKLQGEATGDIGFWAPHVQKFDSCRAYWLVIDTLLSRDDKVAALGLLMHWLSQSDRIPLEQGETSFFRLALSWLAAAHEETGVIPEAAQQVGWKRIRRFFDYLEANAGDFWEVPEFTPDLAIPTDESSSHEFPSDAPEDEEADERFGAAYENVVYRDSTDDGMDGSIFDFDAHDEDYLQQASRPIVTRLTFLDQLSLTWKLIAVSWATASAEGKADATDAATVELIEDLLTSARSHVQKVSADLTELCDAVSDYRISRQGANAESMVNYDRLRLLKDTLLEQAMSSKVSVDEALRFLSASIRTSGDAAVTEADAIDHVEDDAMTRALWACLHGDPQTATEVWPSLRDSLAEKPILYVPLNRGGHPRQITEVRSRQQLIQNLLFWLPRLGLLKETFELLDLVRRMEITPVGLGAITEFDDLFEIGCRAIVGSLIDARESADPRDEHADDWLMESLEEIMEPMLQSWLAHSRTLRLSVLEQVIDENEWNELVEFIRRYGRDLFTQRFLNLGNVRGILHQGVESWITIVEEQEEDEYQPVLDALDHGLERDDFIDKLTLILESVIESYPEYRDYNSTTTQSDRGDLLFTLLDFLRLRTSYDRVVWNLRPVVLAHQVLASRGCDDTAGKWRASLNERIRGEAKRHIVKLQELQQKYAMQLPSISKRISERFMRPLMIDYLCALIEPAMYGDTKAHREAAFERIREQAEVFMSEPSGAGLDVPTWLLAMEETVASIRDRNEVAMGHMLESRILPPVALTVEEIQASVDAWRDNQIDDDEKNE